MGGLELQLPSLDVTLVRVHTYFVKGETGQGRDASQQVFLFEARVGPIRVSAVTSAFPMSKFVLGPLWQSVVESERGEEELSHNPSWPGDKLQEWLESSLPYDPLTNVLLTADVLPPFIELLRRGEIAIEQSAQAYIDHGGWCDEVTGLWTQFAAEPVSPTP